VSRISIWAIYSLFIYLSVHWLLTDTTQSVKRLKYLALIVGFKVHRQSSGSL
jgi:hypothetical protein